MQQRQCIGEVIVERAVVVGKPAHFNQLGARGSKVAAAHGQLQKRCHARRERRSAGIGIWAQESWMQPGGRRIESALAIAQQRGALVLAGLLEVSEHIARRR